MHVLYNNFRCKGFEQKSTGSESCRESVSSAESMLGLKILEVHLGADWVKVYLSLIRVHALSDEG